jgi:hypothetical protein
MRSTLTPDGKLPPPKSVRAALVSVGMLRKEIERIDLQLINGARAVKLGVFGYDSWRKKAEGARRLFRKELLLVEEWIAQRTRTEDAAKLLTDVRKVLQTLKEDDALEPDEIAVAQRLDQFLDGGA